MSIKSYFLEPSFPWISSPRRLFDPAQLIPLMNMCVYAKSKLLRTSVHNVAVFEISLRSSFAKGKFCFTGLLRHTWSSAYALAAKTHRERGGLAELKRLHCTWCKSRLPHLFLMFEQLADEISVCVCRRPLGQTVWHPEISPMVQYWADLHIARQDLFLFVCYFEWNWRARGKRCANSNMW